MNRLAMMGACGAVAAGLWCAGYGATHAWSNTPGAIRLDDASEPVAVASIKNAAAHKDEITGTVTFTQENDGVKVVADIEGLTPGSHGIHIHDKPDLSDPNLKSAGGHYNPGGEHHGGPDTAHHHAGDLGNIVADEKGHAHLEEHVSGLSVDRKNPVVGHSVIIHAKADDLKTDPAGDSGARIAGGAIEIQKSPGKK